MAVLLAVGVMLLQIPRIQTFVAHRVVHSLSKGAIDADIHFSELKFKPVNTLIIKNVEIVDHNPYQVDTASLDKEKKRVFRNMGYTPVDTIFTAENVTATFTLRGLRGEGVRINTVTVRGARMNLVLEESGHSTNLTRVFNIPEKQYKEPVDKESFLIKEATVDGLRFTMKNYKMKCHDLDDRAINWNDLDIRDIQLHARNMRSRAKIMYGEVDYVSFNEKTGYRVTELSGQTRVGQGMALIEDLVLTDPWSSVDIPTFSMHYEHPWDFKHFVDKVRLVAEVNESEINMQTLGYFVRSLERKDFGIDFSGSIDGTVNSLGIPSLDFSSRDNLVRGNLSGNITNMAAHGGMAASVNLKNLHFTTDGLDSMISAVSAGGSSLNLDKYAENVDFVLNGSLKGTLDSLKFNGYITSGVGSLVTDLKFTGLTGKTAATGIAGVVRTSDLNVNSLIGTIPVGECTLDAGLTASLPGKGGSASLSIDSLRVKKLNFNNYDYTNIAATGMVSDKQFDGKIICGDPSLNFLFQGIMAVSGKTNNAVYRFYANVGHADLFALNLDRRGRSEVTMQLAANFTKTGSGELLGSFGIGDIVLENKSGKYDIGNISIESYERGDSHSARLSSGFAQGTFSGTAAINTFFKDIVNISAKRELPALFEDPQYEWEGNCYNLSLRTFKTTDLLSFVAPGVYIAENTTFDLSIDEAGEMKGKVLSQRLAYNEHNVKDAEIRLGNSDGALTCDVNGQNVSIAGMNLMNNLIALRAEQNHVSLDFGYDNEGENASSGKLLATCEIDRIETGPRYTINLLPSSFYIDGKELDILPSGVLIENKTYTVDSLEIRSGVESITAAGKMSEDSADTLNINVGSVDISVLNYLIGEHFDIKGRLSGLAQITSPGKPRGIMLDFICDSTSIAGESMGQMKITSEWDNTFKRFDIGVSNSIDGTGTFSITGNYSPTIRQIELRAGLRQFKLAYVAPMLRTVFSEVDGSMSGDIMVFGPLDNLSIRTRDATLENALLRVGYTNVAYTAGGIFHADDFGIYFDDITLTDPRGREGTISGKIGYEHFHNMNFDTRIDLQRVRVIDLDEKQAANGFYGQLSVTGPVTITGPMNAITLSADVSTAGSGELHVPISSSHNAGSTDLLTFKEEEQIVEIDPYLEMVTRLREEKTSDFAVLLNVSANPEIEAWVEIDKSSGNILKGRGSGQIGIEVRPSKDLFELSGDYTLSSGSYRFVAMGLAARDFTIDDGSSVRFGGDIMSSSLDIGATYKTKASLSTLIADTTASSTRHTVECGVKVTDKLNNPRLSFSINIPDLDPTTKARVESALSTEDKVQKQFLSLLISNSFIPDEQSGIVNSSSVLFSNVSEIMANQLNNIFQKLDIPLDLGLNYQQTDSGNDVFDVAVSTQLFNNRLEVNGNIGNRQYSSSSGSDVAGDLDIEIKLDRQGSFSISLFSHSADEYTNYLDDSQRNGVGFAYQQEFNNFRQWLKRTFTRRRKKREMDAEAAMVKTMEKYNEIKIEGRN